MILDIYRGKGYALWVIRMANALQPSNNSKVLNSEASIPFRTEVVRDHFMKSRDLKTMHDDGISTEKIRRGTYFIENEKKEEKLPNLCNEAVILCIGFARKK